MKLDKTAEKKELKKEKAGQRINILLIRYFKWLVVFSVFIVLFSGCFLLFKPKYQQITQVIKSGEDGRQQEYLERRQYLERIENLIYVYRRIKSSDIKKVNFILAEKDVSEELFAQVESIVKKNGLILRFLEIEGVSQGSKRSTSQISRTRRGEEEEAESTLPAEIGKIKATLNVIGIDYFSLKNFLVTMENNLKLMDIIKLDFQPENSSAELDFYTYYLKE